MEDLAAPSLHDGLGDLSLSVLIALTLITLGKKAALST